MFGKILLETFFEAVTASLYACLVCLSIPSFLQTICCDLAESALGSL